MDIESQRKAMQEKWKDPLYVARFRYGSLKSRLNRLKARLEVLSAFRQENVIALSMAQTLEQAIAIDERELVNRSEIVFQLEADMDS